MMRRDVLIAALVAVGTFAGITISFMGQAAWHSLGKPPGSAEKITAATQNTVFVQSADGNDYAYYDTEESYWRGGEPKGQWVTDAQQAESWELADCGKSVVVHPVILPPQPIKDSIGCWSKVWNNRIGIIYVVLEDGSVWRWSTPLMMNIILAPFFLGCFGGLSGFAIGIILLRLK
jgi:hypothetical protein